MYGSDFRSIFLHAFNIAFPNTLQKVWVYCKHLSNFLTYYFVYILCFVRSQNIKNRIKIPYNFSSIDIVAKILWERSKCGVNHQILYNNVKFCLEVWRKNLYLLENFNKMSNNKKLSPCKSKHSSYGISQYLPLRNSYFYWFFYYIISDTFIFEQRYYCSVIELRSCDVIDYLILKPEHTHFLPSFFFTFKITFDLTLHMAMWSLFYNFVSVLYNNKTIIRTFLAPICPFSL